MPRGAFHMPDAKLESLSTHPPFIADSEANLRPFVTRVLKAHDRRLSTLFVPILERLTQQERVTIDANRSISDLAEMWEANNAVLRDLLLPLPPTVLALPEKPGDGIISATANDGCDMRGNDNAKPIYDPYSAYTTAEQLLAHIARDWSEQGAVPRARTHRHVLRALARMRRAQRRPLSVFVPGAGAGRLAWEIARRGDRVEANDESPLMLVAARRLMGAGPRERRWRIHPRAGCAGGLAPRAACSRSTVVGLPSSTATSTQTAIARRLTLHVGSWCAGGGHGAVRNASFDAVVTSYFLDALPDPAAAVRTIRRLLRPGGVWINVGPLHWHHAAAGLLRLPLDELLQLLSAHGFARVRARPLGAVPYLVSAAPRGPWQWLRQLLPLRGRWHGHPGMMPLRDESHDVVYWQAHVSGPL